LRGVVVTVPDGDHSRTLLDRVDLDVAPGEVLVMTGASGSGKSTLLAVAGLLRRPGSGDVLIGGTSTADRSERRRSAMRKRHIGIVYQSANLLSALTAREQLQLVGHINGTKGAVARVRADELLADVGLSHRADALPAHLSGGERQRVGVARALMASPSVLLADEPTAALDPALAQEIATLLAEQTRRRGLATVVVTHDGAPLQHADRCLQLVDGALVERDLVAS
jgi:putative ABC transport system ATP-binding protein